MPLPTRWDFRNSDLPKPRCPLRDDQDKGCLTWLDGKLTYYINRHCLTDLIWSCWFNYTESPYGEDPSLTNDYYENLTDLEHHVEYSETIVMPDDDIWRDTKYPEGYKISGGRLDFYVKKSEFKKAFYEVKRLGRKEGNRWIKEVRIFRNLRVVLLRDVKFGEMSFPE